MRIVIIGIGALGCLLGARLEPVADVVLLGHWPAQLAALRRDGLRLEHPDGSHSRHRLAVADDPAAISRADVALVAVKSRQTPDAAGAAERLLGSDGLALTLQNGLNNRAALRAVLGEARVALGVTAQGATTLAPGVVRHAGHGPTYFGRDAALGPSQRDCLAALAALFARAGFETQLVDDADGLVWGKLVVNAAINPLTALLRVPNGFLLEHAELVAVMRRTAAEVAAVAERQGIALPAGDPGERAIAVARGTAANRSSMLQDVERGALTEIDAICGAVVRAGRAAGVATPLNSRLADLVAQVESGNPPVAPGDVAGLIRQLDPAMR
ncbi:MAG: 2-dehydropantoate 2-reductase [Anaerolineae bacterium]|nr:2-dehydropantoate 2-reductase [Anaerolineae bacterium]